MCGPQFCAMQITEDVRPTPPNMASPRRKRCKGVWKKRPASSPRKAPSFTRKFEGCALRPACRIGRPRPLRRNSKMGVTEAEAGGGPVDSKRVLPNDPQHWRTKEAAGTTPAGLPRSHFLGVVPLASGRPPRQGSVQRRAASITCNCRSTSRRPAKAFSPVRAARSRALVASATSAQASTRANGVQVGPYLRTVRRPTRAFCSSFIVGRR